MKVERFSSQQNNHRKQHRCCWNSKSQGKTVFHSGTLHVVSQDGHDQLTNQNPALEHKILHREESVQLTFLLRQFELVATENILIRFDPSRRPKNNEQADK
jgi:hypothetical protein